ncbi:MAG: peptidoglycan DD-metalloendopeptidase family protein [Myxococcota bacterium]
MNRKALSIAGMWAVSMTLAAGNANAQPFTYNPPGQLVAGSGQGTPDGTIYASGMRFPIENAPAYANSQVWGNGGMHGPGGGQCDAVNYSYPWWDNFCETRSYSTPMCPSGQGHQGQDIRPSTCDKDVHWAVAAEDGTITNVGTYSVALTTATGRRHNYLHMEPSSLLVSVGDAVQRGERLGTVSNAFGGTPTTIHLHDEIRQNVAGIGDTPVPPYMSLVASSGELLGVPAQPCAVIPPEGGILDDSGPCAQFYGPADSWRDVTDTGHEGNLHWTYAFNDPDPSNWAQWDAHFEEAGDYEVEVHLLPDYAQSRQARYTIRHGGQESERVVDMSAAQQWQSLGVYRFESKGDQHVALYDNTGEALADQRMIMVDAVRFTRVLPPEPLPEGGFDAALHDATMPDVVQDDGGGDGEVDRGEDTGAAASAQTWSGSEGEGCACSAPGARPLRDSGILPAALALLWLRRRRVNRAAKQSSRG